jgi:RNA polymerase sigma-70 factor, ECF subfamily
MGMQMTLSVAPLRDGVLTDWLHAARGGSVEALGRAFESCRSYLLLIARQELRAPLQAKLDAADVVQETFIEATRDFAHFRGETGPQLLGWLRGILRHNLTDLTRRFETNCRRLSQEVRLGGQLGDVAGRSSPFIESMTVCEQLIAQEQRRALDDALQRLPPSYRLVLHLRYREQRSFAEIGSQLRRSPEAARKLWCRALERLRQDMHV